MYCFCSPVSCGISFVSVLTEYTELWGGCQAVSVTLHTTFAHAFVVPTLRKPRRVGQPPGCWCHETHRRTFRCVGGVTRVSRALVRMLTPLPPVASPRNSASK